MELKEITNLINKTARELLSTNNKYYFKSSPFILENIFHDGDSFTALCISSTRHDDEFEIESRSHNTLNTDFISLDYEWSLKLLNFLKHELELKDDVSILPCYNERVEYYYHIDIRHVYWKIDGVESVYRNDLMTPDRRKCYEQLKQQHRNVLDTLKKKYFNKVYKKYIVNIVYNNNGIDTYVDNELIIHCEIIPLKMFKKQHEKDKQNNNNTSW